MIIKIWKKNWRGNLSSKFDKSFMTAQELREKFLAFMKEKGHSIIPSASLVPENDPSVLFTTAGMHPLVPYLLGEKHPGGTRVANVQKCIRTSDIDYVGDNRHLTFFEMMGNWSFGDYFKKEAIEWSWEFLTSEKWLNLNPNRIYVTVFKGEGGVPQDDDAIKFWKDTFAKAGIKAEVPGEDEVINNEVRIIPLGMEDNFWIAGETGPCGGDTEMFYDVRPQDGEVKGKFSELVDNFRLVEIWNDVFMEFKRFLKEEYREKYDRLKLEGKPIPDNFFGYDKLSKQNVDTGMGVERTLAVLNGKETVFDTELFELIFEKLSLMIPQRVNAKGLWYENLNEEEKKSARIIADHIRASVFLIADGVIPSNIGRGYILRRLIRRLIRHGRLLRLSKNFVASLAHVVIYNYGDFYVELKKNNDKVIEELDKEENKFRKTLDKGLKKLEEYISKKELSPENKFAQRHRPDFGSRNEDFINLIPGKDAFDLYQTYGFPPELIREELAKHGMGYHKEEFEKELKQHQDLSRTASAGMFKGGLADTSEQTKKLHTAAHLLLAALRKVLSEDIIQRGSNITPERLRFDFSYPEKLTDEQKKKVENLVNEIIEKNLPVAMDEMSLEEAKKSGAMGVFESKYGERVKVYTIGDGDNIFSREICGGPHVKNAGELGRFKIVKEQSSSGGVRRIKAVLE